MDLKPFFHHTPIRWGIIGCGAVTEVKSGPAYQLTEGFQVAMVMRRDKEMAKDYAERHGIVSYTNDALELIQNPAIDAVYVATPPDSHKFYGLLVANAGKPCCIEKPMAPNFKESLELYNAFQEKNLPLFIAHYRRSLPRFNQVKQWLDEGVIGNIRHVRWYLGKPPNKIDLSGAYNWRTDKKIALGGYFDDLASHGLDLFSYFFGKVKEAKGISINQLGLYDAHDAISASWIYGNGITGEGSWNFGVGVREDWVEIYGSKGKIKFSVFEEQPLQLENGQGLQELKIAHPKHIQQYHVANIKKHLLGIEQHPSLGDSGLHASWVMDKILGVL
ncbi:MAG: Gfo/Idh/MocA family oxidoreductase [Bacteroidota bacterium]